MIQLEREKETQKSEKVGEKRKRNETVEKEINKNISIDVSKPTNEKQTVDVTLLPERRKIKEYEIPTRKSMISSLSNSHKMVYELKKLNIETVEELLQHSSQDILRKAKQLQIKEVQNIIEEVSEKVIEKPSSVYDMLFSEKKKQMKLSIGCQTIDDILSGGILSKTITEVFGEAGSGKSQVCMQLALQVQLPVSCGGLDGSCLYFNTESEFPINRLTQMSKYFAESNKLDVDSILSRILIQNVTQLANLYDLLSYRTYNYIKSNLNSPKNIKLIIIDSIAALVRHQYEHHESVERARDLWLLSKKLLQIADEFNIPIVITNQVSDYFSSSEEVELQNHNIIASLGLSWSNCINNRILLKKTHQIYELESEGKQSTSPKKKIKAEDDDLSGISVTTKTVVRELSVVLSSLVSNHKARFIVTHKGLESV